MERARVEVCEVGRRASRRIPSRSTRVLVRVGVRFRIGADAGRWLEAGRRRRRRREAVAWGVRCAGCVAGAWRVIWRVVFA